MFFCVLPLQFLHLIIQIYRVAGNQIQSVAKSVYKVEGQAAGQCTLISLLFFKYVLLLISSITHCLSLLATRVCNLCFLLNGPMVQQPNYLSSKLTESLSVWTKLGLLCYMKKVLAYTNSVIHKACTFSGLLEVPGFGELQRKKILRCLSETDVRTGQSSE